MGLPPPRAPRAHTHIHTPPTLHTRYAGKRLYESSLKQTHTPLGLLLAAVGGSPIEYWVPPVDPHDVNKNPCYEDR